MRRGVGETRERLAEMLREGLMRNGVAFTYFDGEALLPVTGYYKSQDVYRWESRGLHAIAHDKEQPMSICGWAPMKAVVRSGGVELSHSGYGRFTFEADPVHPPVRRRKRNG